MAKFIKKSSAQAKRLTRANPDKTTVREYFQQYRTTTDGLAFGIEVEVESHNDLYPSVGSLRSGAPLWDRVADGSLRDSKGNTGGGAEFVNRRPIVYGEVKQALTNLESCLTKARTSINPSIRTSVHVHMNVQDLTLRQLATFMSLYYTVEPLLSRYNGEEREHNLFCMQARQSPMMIEETLQFLETRMFRDNLKYSAMNVMPLSGGSFGTLEFRSGKGINTTPMEIVPWVDMLKEIYDNINKFAMPHDIAGMFSTLTPVGYLKEFFPFIEANCVPCFSSEEEVNDVMYESLRATQSIAYDIDWSSYEPTKKNKKKVSSDSSLNSGWPTGTIRTAPPVIRHGQGRTFTTTASMESIEEYMRRDTEAIQRVYDRITQTDVVVDDPTVDVETPVVNVLSLEELTQFLRSHPQTHNLYGHAYSVISPLFSQVNSYRRYEFVERCIQIFGGVDASPEEIRENKIRAIHRVLTEILT